MIRLSNMASTTQQNYPHAREQYPHYSGFFGYITPYNDGTNVKLLRTDGTLHSATANAQDQPCQSHPHYSACDCKPGPHTIQNWQQPAGFMRWCPSDSNTAPCQTRY